MPQISLYETIIAGKAKRLSQNFPEHLRNYARKTIETLLEASRDLAVIDGKTTEEGSSRITLDNIRYRSGFDRNAETISMYCEFAATSDKPLSILRLLSEGDYLPLIRLDALRSAIKEGLPLDDEELRKKLEELRAQNQLKIRNIAEEAERIERIESTGKSTYGVYKGTPFDSRPDYEKKD
ncbi:MAG: hypothetical protein AABX54_00870 [Nanoarchaeota archaeon]